MGGLIRRDRRPLALQVRDQLADSIRGQSLRPGDRLPSEATLVEQYSVARTTVREALKLLEQDGLVAVQAGRGRFVSADAHLRVERPVTRFESVTEMVASRGYRLKNTVVGLAERPASSAESIELDLAGAAPVIQLDRIRMHGREPLIYSIDVFPREMVEGAIGRIDWTGSLLKVFQASGRRAVSATSQISATFLPADRPAQLSAHEQVPWLLIVETCYDERSLPLLCARLYHRADIFSFNVLRRTED
jgi:GntR family transcriptional regulator